MRALVNTEPLVLTSFMMCNIPFFISCVSRPVPSRFYGCNHTHTHTHGTLPIPSAIKIALTEQFYRDKPCFRSSEEVCQYVHLVYMPVCVRVRISWREATPLRSSSYLKDWGDVFIMKYVLKLNIRCCCVARHPLSKLQQKKQQLKIARPS